MDISERLKELRTSNGVTQTQVADAAGMKVAHYQRYEYGERVPRIEQLISLADFYGVSLDYLVGRTEDADAPIAPSIFRTRLIKRRQAMGLTQKELAQRAGCSERSISRYEAGEAEPRVGTALEIVRALDTSLEYLYGDVDDPADGHLRGPLKHYDNQARH